MSRLRTSVTRAHSRELSPDAVDRVLSSFPESLSRKAARSLEQFSVDLA
jgi:hypothetical protein